jgi:hypothetical protein
MYEHQAQEQGVEVNTIKILMSNTNSHSLTGDLNTSSSINKNTEPLFL